VVAMFSTKKPRSAGGERDFRLKIFEDALSNGFAFGEAEIIVRGEVDAVR